MFVDEDCVDSRSDVDDLRPRDYLSGGCRQRRLLQCFERSSLKTDSARPGQAKPDQGFYNNTHAGFYAALSLEQIQQYIDLYHNAA